MKYKNVCNIEVNMLDIFFFLTQIVVGDVMGQNIRNEEGTLFVCETAATNNHKLQLMASKDN